jgi:hypothetical protein
MAPAFCNEWPPVLLPTILVSAASETKPKFIYLLNADEVDPKSIPSNAFVVYQGHHDDLGAQLADVACQARRTQKRARRG